MTTEIDRRAAEFLADPQNINLIAQLKRISPRGLTSEELMAFAFRNDPYYIAKIGSAEVLSLTDAELTARCLGIDAHDTPHGDGQVTLG